MSENLSVENPSDVVSGGAPRKIGSYLFGLILVALCITNALLIKQNYDLKAAKNRSEPEYLKPGQQVPPLVAQRVSGEAVTINPNEAQKTVFFVFAPGCVACEYTAPQWKLIENASSQKGFHSFAATLGNDDSKGTAFLSAHGLRSELLTHLSSQTKAAYQLTLTPLTIVVDAQGKVDKIWPGAFTDDMRSEVELYFGISLNDRASN